MHALYAAELHSVASVLRVFSIWKVEHKAAITKGRGLALAYCDTVLVNVNPPVGHVQYSSFKLQLVKISILLGINVYQPPSCYSGHVLMELAGSPPVYISVARSSSIPWRLQLL